MRICFIRHGDPDYEKDCLTELGHKQAEAAARRLLTEGIEKVFSSPMGRARQTAQYFVDAANISDLHILDFMKEIRYGLADDLYNQDYSPWSGVDKLAEQGEDLQNPEWKKFPLFDKNTATEDIEKVQQGCDIWLESLGYKREGLYYRNINSQTNEHTFALFSHGGSSTAFLSRILNIPFPLLCGSLHTSHTGISIIRFDKNPGKLSLPVIELLNDSSHIKGIV